MKNFLLRLSLSQQFLMLSFPILLGGTLLIGRWIGEEVEESVVRRIGGVTALYVDSFVAPHVQGLQSADDLTAEDRAALANVLATTPLGKKIIGLRIWRPDGRILFSNDPAQVGEQFPIEEGLATALRGEISSEVSERGPGSEAHGQPLPRVIETYTPIHADRMGKVIAAAEFYERPDEVDREAGVAQRHSWMMFGAVMLTIYALLFAVVNRGSRTIVQQQRELGEQIVQLTGLNEQNTVLHQRVKRAAERATALNENFLQRLSADLHDGPGQDLGFALMQLQSIDAACAAQNEGVCLAKNLSSVRVAVESALTDLRAISADLHLPDVDQLSLAELVGRAVRDYESKTGSKVQLECSLPDVAATGRIKITLCRVLQESLANVFRHAQGRHCRVHVTGSAETITVAVSDEGPGFQPGCARRHGRLGLAGMRERVEVVGGVFTIESGVHRGTTVRAVLPLKSSEEQHA